MFVFFSLHVFFLISISVAEVKWWSECCLVIVEPRAGGGGALGKDTLRTSTVPLEGTLVIWLVYFWCGLMHPLWTLLETYNLWLLTWPPFSQLPPCRPPSSPCPGPLCCLLRHSFFGMLRSSAITLHSPIKHLVNIYSLLGSIVGVEGRAQNTKGKDFSEKYIVEGGDR